MGLQLNDQELFKEYKGINREQMPLLRADGRVPLSVAGLMRRRLEVLESKVAPEVCCDAWWNNYFDTGDAAAFGSFWNCRGLGGSALHGQKRRAKQLGAEGYIVKANVEPGDIVRQAQKIIHHAS